MTCIPLGSEKYPCYDDFCAMTCHDPQALKDAGPDLVKKKLSDTPTQEKAVPKQNGLDGGRLISPCDRLLKWIAQKLYKWFGISSGE